jgi:hypothetical protein
LTGRPQPLKFDYMKRIRIAFSVAVLAIVLYSPVLGGQIGSIGVANAGTLCSDGWMSPSQGRGTCSWHGGVLGGGSSSGSRGSFSQPTNPPYWSTNPVSPRQPIYLQPIERRPIQPIERIQISPILPRQFPNPIIQPVTPREFPTNVTPRLQLPSQRRQPLRTTPQQLTSPSKLPPVSSKPYTSQFTPSSNSAGQGMDPALILGLIALFGGVMFYIGHRSSSLATQSASGSSSSQQTELDNDSRVENSASAREVSGK